MKIPFLMFFVRAKRFLRENPGVVFVLGFQVLLVTCAVLLVSGLSFLAEGLAVAAYFLLVIGVVLQLVSFLRGRDGGGVVE
jgi:heme/copper-type cytochrome/quinol oxidase subunit 4